MRYLHTMVRVTNIEDSLDFYCNKMGMTEIRRHESEKGRFTLIFLAGSDDVEAGKANSAPLLELTYNWDPETYSGGRNFGHLAYEVDNIYDFCENLQKQGVTINRPRAMAAWPSSVRRTTFPSSCFKRVKRLKSKNPGPPCPIPANGKTGQFSTGAGPGFRACKKLSQRLLRADPIPPISLPTTQPRRPRAHRLAV